MLVEGRYSIQTPRGYCFFLTKLPPMIGPVQVANLYWIRWEIGLAAMDLALKFLPASFGQSSENERVLRLDIYALLGI